LSAHVDAREEYDGRVEILVGDVRSVGSIGVVAAGVVFHIVLVIAAAVSAKLSVPFETVVVVVIEVVVAASVAMIAKEGRLRMSNSPPEEGFYVRRHGDGTEGISPS